MRTLFERIMMGGDHIPCASLTQLAEVLADAAMGINTTTEDVVFASSMAMSRFDAKDHSDLFMRNLLITLTTSHYDDAPQVCAFRLGPSEIPIVAKAMGIEPATLRAELSKLTARKIETRSMVIHAASPPVDVEIMAVTMNHGSALIQPRALIPGIDAQDPMDSAFVEATAKLVQANHATPTGDTPEDITSVSFARFVRATYLTLVRANHPDTSATNILETIKKRYLMGLFGCARAPDSIVDWLMDTRPVHIEPLLHERSLPVRLAWFNSHLLTPKTGRSASLHQHDLHQKHIHHPHPPTPHSDLAHCHRHQPPGHAGRCLPAPRPQQGQHSHPRVGHHRRLDGSSPVGLCRHLLHPRQCSRRIRRRLVASRQLCLHKTEHNQPIPFLYRPPSR